MNTVKAGQTTFHYNSDTSGDVVIVRGDGERLSVPCWSVLEFVAQIIRDEQIAKIEVATARDLLGLKPKQ